MPRSRPEIVVVFDAGALLPDPARPLLDVRDRAAFIAGHIAPATHIPFADLSQRRHELPAPGTPLQVLADHADTLHAAIAQLTAWQYPLLARFLLDASLQARALAASQWQRGYHSQRLWQPSQTLALALSLRAVQEARDVIGNSALDVACGSGRDALYLAQHGYAVTAVDIKPDALTRLAASAEAADLSVQAICQDLERDLKSATPDWAVASFALIHVARYLHRPLLPQLMHWLTPGGVLIYETFLRGAEHHGGPRRPQFLLERGELRAMFADWQILHDVESTLSDGRPVQQFIAVRS